MDYSTILDLAVEIGYKLAMNGAETFRIEESIHRILQSYNISAEVFAIPNCLHVSIEAQDGVSITKMRRIGLHGNDLDTVEKYSNLSRRICTEKPEPALIRQWLKETEQNIRKYPLPIYFLGNFLGSFGFCILFGGSYIDCFCAGICGLVIGLVSKLMENLKVNQFFKTIFASFVMALLAYLFNFLSICNRVDSVIIGALMILVPGLIFTNGMRDIIYGDTNSGINRFVQVFLIAAAIALGTGAAWSLGCSFFGIPASVTAIPHHLIIECIAAFVGCIGFVVLFNIYGFGGVLCALGGVLAWVAYRIVSQVAGNEIAGYFWGAALASLYSEIMARIRKFPAISYLVISSFPLIPGAGVYYAMNYAVRGDMTSFASQGGYTIAIAGVIAVGILISSTFIRVISIKRRK